MIYTLTLNPAVDKIFYLSQVVSCTTNRIQRQTQAVGGKGTHVSINLGSLGIENKALGFTYGETGEFIRRAMQVGGVTPMFCHHAEGESRTNYLIIEESTGSCTILAEKGTPPTAENMKELKDLMDSVLQTGDWLVLSGDASNCPDPFVYNSFIREYSKKGVRIVLDSSGETLVNALSEKPYLIKPNQDELAQIMGNRISGMEETAACAQSLYEQYGIPYIAVSMGGEGSVFRTPKGVLFARPPRAKVRNTAGCGDCFLAGLLCGLSTGLDEERTLRLATAVSAATAESPLSVGYDAQRADSFLKLVSIHKSAQAVY